MKVEDTATKKIRGWGCTPTGDSPPAVEPNTSNAVQTSCLLVWVSRGWKINLLYAIIVFLMVLVFVNIALTLWIISTLSLTVRGMIGPITILKDGVRIDGQVWVVDKLVASTISSQMAQHITLHSHSNFSVLVSESGHINPAKLVIKRDGVECSGKKFEINDARGDEVFYASREEIRVSAETLTLDGAGGLIVKNALQTPVIRAQSGSDLQLESLTRRLDVRAPQSIFVESKAGSIDIKSHSNITLKSDVGAIKLQASNIMIHNLKEATAKYVLQKSTWEKKVYQLCVCASGKLFLAAADSVCASDDYDAELCR